MSELIPRKVAIVIMCLFSLVAHAQSYYNDEYCDPDIADCDQFDTELIGDPDPGPGRCNSAEIFSTLNGLYKGASSVYPNDATVDQAVAGVASGVSYPWTYTEYFYTPSLPSGCVLVKVTFDVTIGVRQSQWTYYTGQTVGGPADACSYNALTCNATCGKIGAQRFIVGTKWPSNCTTHESCSDLVYTLNGVTTCVPGASICGPSTGTGGCS